MKMFEKLSRSEMKNVLGGVAAPPNYGCFYSTTDSGGSITTTAVTVDGSGCSNADGAMNDICVAAVTQGGASRCTYHCNGC